MEIRQPPEIVPERGDRIEYAALPDDSHRRRTDCDSLARTAPDHDCRARQQAPPPHPTLIA